MHNMVHSRGALTEAHCPSLSAGKGVAQTVNNDSNSGTHAAIMRSSA